MPIRPGQRALHAWCENCAWESDAANAQGTAARHHDRSGHTVHVVIAVTYGDGRIQIDGQTNLIDAIGEQQS